MTQPYFTPKWQTHRFGDSIAVCIGTGETVYLTTQQARALSGGINAACRSIEREPFGQSTGLTRSGEALHNNKPRPRAIRDESGAMLSYDREAV